MRGFPSLRLLRLLRPSCFTSTAASPVGFSIQPKHEVPTFTECTTTKLRSPLHPSSGQESLCIWSPVFTLLAPSAKVLNLYSDSQRHLHKEALLSPFWIKPKGYPSPASHIATFEILSCNEASYTDSSSHNFGLTIFVSGKPTLSGAFGVCPLSTFSSELHTTYCSLSIACPILLTDC